MALRFRTVVPHPQTALSHFSISLKSAPMLTLRTFGGAVVLDDSGEQLGAAASQRRILALLALLAVAGDGGLSRDKIIGLLWPESEEERARHSLTQALYSARRALKCEEVFLISSDIRLNGSQISTDVGALQSALAAGDAATAANIYRGAFLDGFFLSGAAEFEDWIFRERQRFESAIVAALETLAAREESTGQMRAAVEWWRRLSQIRPLDSGIALRLMQALAAIGDRGGALQHAHIHEQLLRAELEIAPDAAI